MKELELANALRDEDERDDEDVTHRDLHADLSAIRARLNVYAAISGAVLSVLLMVVGVVGREIVDLWKADARESEQIAALQHTDDLRSAMIPDLAALRAAAATKTELAETTKSIETTLRTIQLDVATLREHVIRDGKGLTR